MTDAPPRGEPLDNAPSVPDMTDAMRGREPLRAMLEVRAGLLAGIRGFFADRGVLEVETPALAPFSNGDVHIDAIAAALRVNGEPREFYLQTSPEFAMKRLLAAGSGAIYQLGKAFRDDELSRQHNPEFTLLEWYRPHFTMDRLMDEVAELLRLFVPTARIERISYRDAFLNALNLDPHRATDGELAAHLAGLLAGDPALAREGKLNLLMAAKVEPQLPEFCFVHDYPKELCALACLAEDDTGAVVAKRFELYGRGMELANGYVELTDAAEQRRRHEEDNETRRLNGRPSYPMDEKLLAALPRLPPCAGVALGVDRLLMVTRGASRIGEVISFDIHRI